MTLRAAPKVPPLRFLSPLHKANRQVGIHLQEQLAHLGVSNPEGHLLAYLRSYGPCPIAQLLHVFGYKKSTLSSMLVRLERRRLVVREPYVEDRRSFLIDLTEQGERLAHDIRAVVEALERAIGESLTEEQISGFNCVMEAIARATGVQIVNTTAESASEGAAQRTTDDADQLRSREER